MCLHNGWWAGSLVHRHHKEQKPPELMASSLLQSPRPVWGSCQSLSAGFGRRAWPHILFLCPVSNMATNTNKPAVGGIAVTSQHGQSRPAASPIGSPPSVYRMPILTAASHWSAGCQSPTWRHDSSRGFPTPPSFLHLSLSSYSQPQRRKI